MADIKGMGPCAIPNEKGYPCGRQINEGEPIGTVVVTDSFDRGPKVGHRACADGYLQRQQQKAREGVMKNYQQAGPGGAIDASSEKDALINPTPLVPKADRAAMQREGVVFAGDLPMDASQEEAASFGSRPDVQRVDPETYSHETNLEQYASTAPRRVTPQSATSLSGANSVTSLTENVAIDPRLQARYSATPDLPSVKTRDGEVIISDLQLAEDGTLRMLPDDVEDFIKLLHTNADRASRQRRM